MSYCRVNKDCDVYLYSDASRKYCFVLKWDTFSKRGFRLGRWFNLNNIPDTIEVLDELMELGYKFPVDVVERLRDEYSQIVDYHRDRFFD